ncbi:MAG: hypothetical protein ORN98_01865 [Alphaproteobacteria bacterium]|nr:hypothetical protein [Alphaproteobacteria bacterium]
MTLAASLAMIAVGLWVWLILFRGLYWQDDFTEATEIAAATDSFAPSQASVAALPDLVAILPVFPQMITGYKRTHLLDAGEIDQTRLETALANILNQNYPSSLKLIIVDGVSQGALTGRMTGRMNGEGFTPDGASFAALVRQMAERHMPASDTKIVIDEKIRVVPAHLVPAQWSARLWGLSQGLIEAKNFAPTAVYAWFVDAETEYAPGVLRQLVTIASSEPRDLVSILPAQNCRTTFESLAVPAYGYFFRLLYPFAWVADAEHDLAAAGRCVLVRRSSIDALGGLAASFGYNEENALAAAVKHQGGIRVMLSPLVRQTMMRNRLSEIRQLLASDALIRGEDNPMAQLMTALVLLLGFVLPPWFGLFGTGTVSVMGFLAWGAMSLSYIPMINFYRLSPFWAVTLPLAATLYLFSLIESMMSRWTRPNK